MLRAFSADSAVRALTGEFAEEDADFAERTSGMDIHVD
jgi:hypothetical protein